MNDSRDTSSSIEARLRSQARTMRVAPPEGLEQRISAAVWRDRDATQRAPGAVKTRRAFRLLPPAFAGLVASACAVGVVVFWNSGREERAAQREDIHYLVTTVETLPSRLPVVDLQTTGTRVVADPLAREIDSVRADARSALGFLAANFLPSQALASENGAPAQES